MDYIRFAIENPVKVTVGVLLILLFGILSLLYIPVQLTPNVDQPIITVATQWTGRSPEEVEREIIEEQEDKLKGLQGLRKMTATAYQGSAEIELEFFVGIDMDRARQEVSDKLREVPEYPDDVDEPVIESAETRPDKAIAWMMITSETKDFDVEYVRDHVEKRVKPFLERVEGLANVEVYGGRERQAHIQIDPKKMAQRGITFNALRNALRQENVNVSAGDVTEGRLDVRVRTVGQYDDLEAIRQTVVANTDGGPIRVGDLGDVVLALEKRRAFVRQKGNPGLAMPAMRESGSNVMSVMEGLRERIKLVNSEVLPEIARKAADELGLDSPPTLKLTQVYDETIYIEDSVSLVITNLFVGGSLAVLALLIFLRSIRPTIVVAFAIPISVIGTFVALTLSGRNLNVVSLAGLAFAVGMVVDAAIVVLENIDRHLAMGKSAPRAAYDGAKEVWGAILASTLTTLAVFVPVLMIQEEAGQLFRDIALAICAAVTLSLLVSVTVIPSASAGFLKSHTKPRLRITRWGRSLFGLAPMLGRVTDRYADLIHWLVGRHPLIVMTRLTIIAFFTIASVLGAALLMPPATYLPAGNRNLVFGFMLIPPSYSLDHNMKLGKRMESRLEPYWEADSKEELAQMNLPPVIPPFGPPQPVENIPPIEHFFFVSFRGSVFYGAVSSDKDNVKPIEGLLSWAGSVDNPGAIALAFQTSLFGRGLAGGNSIDLEVSGTDLDRLRENANRIYMTMAQTWGFDKVRPQPSNFNLVGPEKQVQIDRVKASDLGIDVAATGLAVQALVDGAIIGDYRLEGDSVDLLLVRHPDYDLSPDLLKQVPLATGTGEDGVDRVIPMSSVVRFVDKPAPQEIRRIEQLRSVTLSISPPEGMPLQTAQEQIEGIITGMREAGAIDPDIETTPAGTADKLTQVREALLGQWYGWNVDSLASLLQSRIFIALLITYLLMAALFESFLYPLVIMFSVPLATVGGFMGLAVVHAYVPSQQLDVLTMLGFVILIGVVVNNAILIVHQALNFMRGLGESEADKRDVLEPREAIAESVRTRMRPVFMTTLTSVSGMLPLVLAPGSGSELYRGLGSVVVGGLIVSTVFTLVVVPLTFSVAIDAKVLMYRLLGKSTEALEQQKEVAPTPA